MVALLVSRATRSHTTDGTGGAAGTPLLRRLQRRVRTDLLGLASRARMREAVGAWKLQIPEEKNVASLAQTELCLPRTLLASELQGSCVIQQYAVIWATYTHLIRL